MHSYILYIQYGAFSLLLLLIQYGGGVVSLSPAAARTTQLYGRMTLVRGGALGVVTQGIESVRRLSNYASIRTRMKKKKNKNNNPGVSVGRGQRVRNVITCKTSDLRGVMNDER